MKAKTILTTLMLTGLLALGAAPALAADPTPTPTTTIKPASPSASTEVKASVNQDYTVTIPNSIDFGTLDNKSTNLSQDLKISATNVLIPASKVLNVKVTSNEGSFVVKAGDASVNYNLYNTKEGSPAAIEYGKEFTAFEGGKPAENQEVNGQITLANAPLNSGTYTGTLTFTCSVDDVTPQP